MLQDDVLPGTSTVWEYLTFHARLRLPEALSDGERAARVQTIIDQLSLGKVRSACHGCGRRTIGAAPKHSS